MRRKDSAGVAYFKSVDRTRRFNDYEKKFCSYRYLKKVHFLLVVEFHAISRFQSANAINKNTWILIKVKYLSLCKIL